MISFVEEESNKQLVNNHMKMNKGIIINFFIFLIVPNWIISAININIITKLKT